MCSELNTQAIVCRLDIEDTAELFVQTACFLTSCLNIGSFEGVAGAKPHVVLKLQIAFYMTLILNNVEDST